MTNIKDENFPRTIQAALLRHRKLGELLTSGAPVGETRRIGVVEALNGQLKSPRPASGLAGELENLAIAPIRASSVGFRQASS
jgi:hypothetical protein